jgi:hypothetical protein
VSILLDAYLTALGVLLAVTHVAAGIGLLAWAYDRASGTVPALRVRARRSARRMRRVA